MACRHKCGRSGRVRAGRSGRGLSGCCVCHNATIFVQFPDLNAMRNQVSMGPDVVSGERFLSPSRVEGSPHK